MTIEEVADLPPAEAVEDIIADAVEAGIIAGETGEAPVITEEEASVIAVDAALVDIAAE
jgi:dihydrodipicolinate synthase/N-acetylneuraminate lyase